MRLKTWLLAAAAVSMTASPVLAAANPATPLSVAGNVRAGAPAGKSKLAGVNPFAAVVALILVAVGVTVIATNDNSDSP